ncbi:MAG: hypothetical protein ACLFTK_13875 [Anaerolineales bacterium]
MRFLLIVLIYLAVAACAPDDDRTAILPSSQPPTAMTIEPGPLSTGDMAAFIAMDRRDGRVTLSGPGEDLRAETVTYRRVDDQTLEVVATGDGWRMRLRYPQGMPAGGYQLSQAPFLQLELSGDALPADMQADAFQGRFNLYSANYLRLSTVFIFTIPGDGPPNTPTFRIEGAIYEMPLAD